MHTDPILQQVLECCYNITLCRVRNPKNFAAYTPIDAMVGEMDWAAELHTLLIRSGLMNNSKANDRQVGGDHYRRVNPAYQHWDMVADFDLNYYVAQATKYVSRWKDKDGLKDLAKAPHYIDKLIELYQQGRGSYVWIARAVTVPDRRLYDWCDGLRLSVDETAIMELAVCYANEDDLLRLRGYIAALYEKASQGNTGPALMSPAVGHGG